MDLKKITWYTIPDDFVQGDTVDIKDVQGYDVSIVNITSIGQTHVVFFY